MFFNFSPKIFRTQARFLELNMFETVLANPETTPFKVDEAVFEKFELHDKEIFVCRATARPGEDYKNYEKDPEFQESDNAEFFLDDFLDAITQDAFKGRAGLKLREDETFFAQITTSGYDFGFPISIVLSGTIDGITEEFFKKLQQVFEKFDSKSVAVVDFENLTPKKPYDFFGAPDGSYPPEWFDSFVRDQILYGHLSVKLFWTLSVIF